MRSQRHLKFLYGLRVDIMSIVSSPSGERVQMFVPAVEAA